MNIPSYEFDPRFVHQTLREKRARAASERLAREVLRTSAARTPALSPVRRLVGLQLVALGTALQGSASEA